MQISVREFLSAAQRTVVGLIDAASSSERALVLGYGCDGPWVEISTADIVSIAIVDFVQCDDNRGFHKATITLTDPTVARRFERLYARGKPTQQQDLENTNARLDLDKMRTLVAANKQSTSFTDECVLAVCWKESSFDPAAGSGASTAKGLMQMTNPAVDTVNNITPVGVHFEYSDMLDAAKAIQCGTYYLAFCFLQTGGDEARALDRYGGVSGYSTNVIQAEACLLSAPADPMACLKKIHL